MAKNFHSEGVTLSILAPATLSSGDVIVAGELKGIAATDADSSDLVAVTVEGVFQLPKLSTAAFDLGEAVFWDVADGQCNEDNTNPVLGYAVAAAANSSATVLVELTP